MPVDRKRLKRLINKEGSYNGLSLKEERELDKLQYEREAEKALSILRPNCCEAAQKYPVIVFSVDFKDNGEMIGNWYYSVNDHISRYIQLSDRNWSANRPPPRYCIFCSSPLPKVVRKKETPKDVCIVKDGGYYCHTCKERLQCCMCDDPSAAFEISNNG